MVIVPSIERKMERESNAYRFGGNGENEKKKMGAKCE